MTVGLSVQPLLCEKLQSSTSVRNYISNVLFDGNEVDLEKLKTEFGLTEDDFTGNITKDKVFAVISEGLGLTPGGEANKAKNAEGNSSIFNKNNAVAKNDKRGTQDVFASSNKFENNGHYSENERQKLDLVA